MRYATSCCRVQRVGYLLPEEDEPLGDVPVVHVLQHGRLLLGARRPRNYGQHALHNDIDEGVVPVGSGMGLFLIVGHWLKILPQNSKEAS